MPIQKLILEPGINTNLTPTLNKGSWSASNLIRWRDGLPEKIDGWLRLLSQACAGLVRGIHAFADLNANKYLILGSANALQVSDGRAIYDVSLPIRVRSLAASGGLSCTNGSFVITINDNNHGRITGESISFPIAVSINNGVTGKPFYPGEIYRITVIDANNYTIQRGSSPTFTSSVSATPSYATTAGSGVVTVTFFDHGVATNGLWIVSRSVDVGGTVVAAGSYSATRLSANTLSITVGSAATTSASALEIADGTIAVQPISNDLPDATNWYIDNFGQIAVFCPEDGPLYQWVPPIRHPSPTVPGPLGSAPLGSGPLGSGPVDPDSVDAMQAGALITNAPARNGGIMVAMPQAQIISWRAESAGIQDPLLLRWCDAGNFNRWTAASTNRAGSNRLSRGTRIVGVVQAPQNTLVWTDLDLWLMQYVGGQGVYSFNVVASGCGLIASKATATLGGVTYWMTQQGFYRFGGGGADFLPCPVWDIVFGDLHPLHPSAAAQAKIWARPIASFNEVVFRFPSTHGNGEIDSYVKFNTAGHWDYGSLVRTAGIDQHVFGVPIEVDDNFRVQQHEYGYDADDEAMEGAFVETGDFDLGDGDDILFIDQIIPDFKWLGTGGYILLTVYSRNYPSDSYVKHGPFTVTANTRFVPLRCRARQVKFRIEWGPVLDYSARLGAVRYRAIPSGRRP